MKKENPNQNIEKYIDIAIERANEKYEKRVEKFLTKTRAETNEDMEEYLKKLNSDSDNRMEAIMKRHVGALTESFTDKLEVIREVVNGHSDTLEIIRSDIDVIKSDMRDVKFSLGMKADKDYVVSLDKRITTLETGKK